MQNRSQRRPIARKRRRRKERDPERKEEFPVAKYANA